MSDLKALRSKIKDLIPDDVQLLLCLGKVDGSDIDLAFSITDASGPELAALLRGAAFIVTDRAGEVVPAGSPLQRALDEIVGILDRLHGSNAIAVIERPTTPRNGSVH